MLVENVAAVLDETLTTIDVVFNEKALEARNPKVWTYKAKRDFAQTLRRGDVLITESGPHTRDTFKVAGSHALVIVFFVRAHETPQIDVEAGFPYLYAFQRVDIGQLQLLRAQETLDARKIRAQARGTNSSFEKRTGALRLKTRRIMHTDKRIKLYIRDLYKCIDLNKCLMH